ncbi:MAG: hypothetical protein NT051_05675, partial [Candidatus Micrarchaeota archaeon]|nr:hypothetical protein [Candidatus Micrarchaeota archaeon]
MKTSAAAALALFTLLLLTSFPSASFNASEFMDAPFYLSGFQYNGQNATAIVSDGSVHAIIVDSWPSGQTALTDANEISQALSGYYAAIGYSPAEASKLSQVHAGILSLRSSKNPGEAECKRLLGTDRNPCTSYDSCQRACYTVTSFCREIALNVGKPFIYNIWEFENHTLAVNAAYDAEALAYNSLSSNFTPKKAEAYALITGKLLSASQKASRSPIFEQYQLCAPPDYAVSTLSNMDTLAKKYSQIASRLSGVDSEALAVRSRTLDGLALMSLRQQNASLSSSNSSQA